jgi:hypothetical protein
VPEAPPDCERVPAELPESLPDALPAEALDPEPLRPGMLDPESEAVGWTEVPLPLVAVPPMRPPPPELEPGDGSPVAPPADDDEPPDEPEPDEEPPPDGMPALGEEEPPEGRPAPPDEPPLLGMEVPLSEPAEGRPAPDEPPPLEPGNPALLPEEPDEPPADPEEPLDPDDPLGEPGAPALPESLPQPATASVAATINAISVGRSPRSWRLAVVIVFYLTLNSKRSTPAPRLLR